MAEAATDEEVRLRKKGALICSVASLIARIDVEKARGDEVEAKLTVSLESGVKRIDTLEAKLETTECDREAALTAGEAIDAGYKEAKKRLAAAERLAVDPDRHTRMQAAVDRMNELGYRFCDVPACNCDRWHAPAKQMTNEIKTWRDEVQEALSISGEPDATSIIGLVREWKKRLAAAERLAEAVEDRLDLPHGENAEQPLAKELKAFRDTFR